MLVKIFRVIKCPNCFLFQVSGSSKSLKCLKCNKSKVLSSLKIFYKSESAKNCQLVLAELKKNEFEEKENNYDNFFSYDNSKNSDLDKSEIVSSDELDDFLSGDFK